MSVSPYNHFQITEPKQRHISSSTFTDRVVQRAMCKDTIYDNLTRCLIMNNAACQTHKGTSFAVNRLQVCLRRHFMEYGTDGFVLRLDIRKFFDNISHGLLKEIVNERVPNATYKRLMFELIDSFNDPIILASFRRENSGIPLGSQMSQLFALNALDSLDHYIVEQLHIRNYVRYMDDLVIIFPPRYFELTVITKLIVGRIECLGFEVNHKSKITHLSDGVKLMHQKFVLTKTGKIIRSIDRKQFKRERRKLLRMFHALEFKKFKKIDIEIILRHYQGWRATAIIKAGKYAVMDMDRLFLQLMKSRKPGSEIHLEHLDGLQPEFIRKFCMNTLINTDQNPASLFK